MSTLAKSYDLWTKSLVYNLNEFIMVLKKQHAFQVIGEIEVFNWEYKIEIKDEMKNLKLSRKEKFTEIKESILKLDDKTLLSALIKKYDELEPYQVKIVKEYYNLRPTLHKDKLNSTGKLFINEKEQSVDLVKAFRFFYNSPWKRIQYELCAKDARLINKDFKTNGVEPFSDKNLYKIRTQKRQQQAKIRWELRDLEKRQGRLSKKLLRSITIKMINEGYFRNKYTKVYLNPK